MKFVAPINKIVGFGLFCSALGIASADNQCDCQSPPGGSVRCEQGQVAFCRIKDGKVVGECKTPPSSIKTAGQYQLWLASEIIGPGKPADQAIAELRKAYETGTYKAKDGTIIKFHMSKPDQMAVFEVPDKLYQRSKEWEG